MSDNQPIVALEVWKQVNVPGRWVAVFVTRLASGAHMIYETTLATHAATVLAALNDNPPTFPVPASLRGFDTAQQVIMEDAGRRMAARCLNNRIGNQVGWQRVYGGDLRLSSLGESDSAFHDADPTGVPSTAPVGTGDGGPTFDADSFAARRKRKREADAREAARAAAAAGLAARGQTTIRALRGGTARLAHVPVVGLDHDGRERAQGVVTASYPSHAIIETSDNPELDGIVLFWYYRPTPEASIAVGVSGTRTEA